MNYGKNILAGLLVGLTLSAVVNAGPTYASVNSSKFNGLYGTIGAGLTQQRYKTTGVGKNSIIKSYLGLGASTSRPGGLFAAIEAQVGMNNILRDKIGSDVFDNLGTDQGYKTKIVGTHYNATLLGKLGLQVFPNTIVYGVAGPDLTNYKFRSRTQNISKSKQALNLGYAVGGGVETYVAENVTLGATYLFSEHKRVKSTNLREFFREAGAGNLDVDNIKPTVRGNTVVVNLGLRF